MGALAIGTGAGLPFSPAAPIWYDVAASLDADFAGARFYWDGRNFADEATFLIEIGASGSGSQRVFGPYVDPAATELLSNGNFGLGNLSSWTTVLNGSSSASVVAGAASLASDGSSGTGSGGAGIAQAGATTIDKAYRTLHDVVSAQVLARLGGNTSVSSGVLTANQLAGLAYLNTFCAEFVSSYFYACRVNAGTAGVDNVSMKECLPFKGFVQGGGTIVVEATTPAVASGTKVAFELGQRTSQGAVDPGRRIHLAYNASGRLVLDIRYRGTTTVSFDLGAVAANTAFKVRLGYKANEFYAQLDNDPITQNLAANPVPGFGAMYIGRSALTDKHWDGGISRVRVYNGGGFDQFIGLTDVIHTEGDSFVSGNSGVVLWSTLQTLMGRAVHNTAEGGSTPTSIRDRIVATGSGLRSRTTLIWDGSEYPISTLGEVPGYIALMQQAVAALGHGRFILIPPCLEYHQSGGGAVEAAIRDAMLATWPGNVVDWRTVLPLDGNGAPTDPMFVNAPTDTVHLSQAAIDLVAAAIQAFIDARGW